MVGLVAGAEPRHGAGLRLRQGHRRRQAPPRAGTHAACDRTDRRLARRVVRDGGVPSQDGQARLPAGDAADRRGADDSAGAGLSGESLTVLPARVLALGGIACSCGCVMEQHRHFRAGSFPTHSGVGCSASKYSKIRWMRSVSPAFSTACTAMLLTSTASPSAKWYPVPSMKNTTRSLVSNGTWILCGHFAAGFASRCGLMTPPGAMRASITRGNSARW